MHKNGKWARQIIGLQDAEGKWGFFHSLSKNSNSPITTEQALRRLERLGFTIEDVCIQMAVSYMGDCLTGKKCIPDRREKTHDWDLFTAMMLAAWIRRFTSENETANRIAAQWAAVVSHAFAGGVYDHSAYTEAFQAVWGKAPKGGRFADFTSFYQISLLSRVLGAQTELALLDYVLNKEDGIYYIYGKKLTRPPVSFESREASRYLAALELLADYRLAKDPLGFAAEWLMARRSEAGTWDMGNTVNDKVNFPLSDDWRRKEARIADCTERIGAFLKNISK